MKAKKWIEIPECSYFQQLRMHIWEISDKLSWLSIYHP